MRFRNQLAWTLLLQGGGVAAGLMSLALLGIYLGPAAQGTFSFVKIEVAFIGSFAVFGLTQALFYYVKTSRISIGRAKNLAIMSSVLGGLIGLGYGVYVQRWSGDVLVAFAVACAAFARFGCLRGIVLAARSTRSFNVLTALPQGLLLLYTAAAVWVIGRVNNFDATLAFAAAYILSSLIAIRTLAGGLNATPTLAKEEKVTFVMRYGFASGITEVSASVSLWLAAKTVAARLGGVDLGIFTLAVTLSQGLLVPLSYASPLLFKRWIERPDAAEAMKGGVLVFLTLGVLAFIVRTISEGGYELEPWLGKYSMLAAILWIVLIATAFDGFQKALVAYVYAQGFPWLPAISEMSRMLVVAAGLTFWPIHKTGDVAWIVCFAAMTSSAALLIVHLWMSYARKGLAT